MNLTSIIIYSGTLKFVSGQVKKDELSCLFMIQENKELRLSVAKDSESTYFEIEEMKSCENIYDSLRWIVRNSNFILTQF